MLRSHFASHCQAIRKQTAPRLLWSVFNEKNKKTRTIVRETCKQGRRSALKKNEEKKNNKPFTCEHVATKHKHVAQIPGLLKNLHNARKLSGTLKAKTEGFHTREKKCMGKTVRDIMSLRNNRDALPRKHKLDQSNGSGVHETSVSLPWTTTRSNARCNSVLGFVLYTYSVQLTFATETTVPLCWCQQTAEANRGVLEVFLCWRHDSVHSVARHETKTSGWKGKCEQRNNSQNAKERTQERKHSLLKMERKPASGSTILPTLYF